MSLDIPMAAIRDSVHPLAEENRRFQAAMRADRHTALRQRYDDLLKGFLGRSGGSMVHPLSLPLLFPERTFQELAAAGKTLLGCQKKILQVLSATRSRAELLDFFQLPGELADMMDWDALLAGETPMVRFDILASTDGGFRFCEFNVDTAVGGSEAVELAVLFGQALEQSARGSGPLLARLRRPYADVGALLAHHIREKGLERVVLLDWSTWADKGYFSSNLLREAIQEQVGGIWVLAADETSYPELGPVSRRDLVFRSFLYEDVQGNPDFIRLLRRSCQEVVSLFECEVFSSKLWFAFFHDEEFTACLSDDERACITRYVPPTFTLSPANASRFLQSKDDYVVKDFSSSGGRGVYLGRDHSAAFFEDLFATTPNGWIVQEYVEQPTIPVVVGPTLDPQEHRLVLGLYNIHGRDSGLMVRCHPSRGVINVASGAHVGWAVVLDDPALGQLTAFLHDGCSP